jgi:PadR family transcriptional regulator PadR
VVAALMDAPDAKHWGYDTGKKSGVRPGAMYPILGRLLDAGWLADGWEPSAAGKHRPARRYYTVTDLGRTHLRALLDEASRDSRFAALDLNHDDKMTKG